MSNSKFTVPPGFIEVRSSTLVPDRELGVDVFVPVNGRPIMYGGAGQILEKNRFDRLREFKKKKVLIRDKDEEAYRGYLEKTLFLSLEDDKVSVAQKTELISSAAESAADEVLKKPHEKTSYLNSQLYFSRFGETLKKHGDSFAEVLNAPYDSNAQDHVSHGLQVAALSIFLCDKLELVKNDAHRTSIITGCFLHDIGLESSGIHRNLEARSSEAWKEHPMVGASILNDKDYVDAQVLTIILQHEELPNGDGFPKKLLQKQMDPVAVVVSLANRFDDYVQKTNGDKRVALEKMFVSELGHFDLSLLQRLQEVLKQNIR